MHQKQRAAAEERTRLSIVRPLRALIRGEGKEVKRLLRALRPAMVADLETMTRKLRDRCAQNESAFAARLREIDASLNLIAREMARRSDDPPSHSTGR